jgi:hypothetical protein
MTILLKKNHLSALFKPHKIKSFLNKLFMCYIFCFMISGHAQAGSSQQETCEVADVIVETLLVQPIKKFFQKIMQPATSKISRHVQQGPIFNQVPLKPTIGNTTFSNEQQLNGQYDENMTKDNYSNNYFQKNNTLNTFNSTYDEDAYFDSNTPQNIDSNDSISEEPSYEKM